MRITTNVFRLSRTELARIASLEYLRSYWFFVAPVPIAGIFAVIFGSLPMQVMGMMAILWPFSIPARSVVATTKISRLFSFGCHLEATEDELVFIGEYNKEGKRLRYPIATDRIRETFRTGGIIIIRLRMPGFTSVREDAFRSDADRDAFLKLVADAVERRQSDEAQGSAV